MGANTEDQSKIDQETMDNQSERLAEMMWGDPYAQMQFKIDNPLYDSSTFRAEEELQQRKFKKNNKAEKVVVKKDSGGMQQSASQNES